MTATNSPGRHVQREVVQRVGLDQVRPVDSCGCPASSASRVPLLSAVARMRTVLRSNSERVRDDDSACRPRQPARRSRPRTRSRSPPGSRAWSAMPSSTTYAMRPPPDSTNGPRGAFSTFALRSSSRRTLTRWLCRSPWRLFPSNTHGAPAPGCPDLGRASRSPCRVGLALVAGSRPRCPDAGRARVVLGHVELHLELREVHDRHHRRVGRHRAAVLDVHGARPCRSNGARSPELASPWRSVPSDRPDCWRATCSRRFCTSNVRLSRSNCAACPALVASAAREPSVVLRPPRSPRG